MKILSIVILTSKTAADHVQLSVDMVEGTWPYKNNASFTTRVASGAGEEYVKKNFPGVPYEIISMT